MRLLPTFLLAAAVLALTACVTTLPAASPAPTATPPASPDGPGLLFQVEPPEALVTVDGAVLGPASGLAGRVVPVTPGIHQVMVTLPGADPWRAELEVRGQVELIRASLVRAP